MRTRLPILLIALLTVCLTAPSARALTDEEVLKAIEKGQAWLISRQQAGGQWPEGNRHGESAMAVFTLVYTGIHPNRAAVSEGMDSLLTRSLDCTYAVSMRCMAYAYLQRKLSGQKRDMVRKALKLDAMWLSQAQGSHGGWNYTSLGGSGGRYDFSNTQMAILALREAALAGCEIPEIVWKRAQKLYYENQQDDGSWEYQGKDNEGYGSMTAAGLASIFITMDNLNLASGCPCRGGRSKQGGGEFERRADRTLAWLEKHFNPSKNPKKGNWPKYWLYSVERVGIAAGYKYFGDHNWFKEGAEHLVKSQGGGGNWGGLPQTCFSILFLYKGRAPVLYNKLEFEGIWNPHRRDIANLTGYIQNVKEQMFHWQIVSLRAPVAELHDAPVLFISAESIPEFSEGHKKKLREFTDTGGTILLEASCGNAAVRGWAREFFQELWPEWPLKPLGPDHGSFKDPHRLQQRPEIFGKHDGVRTFLFYAMDDISCPWQTKALAGRKYLFDWGINLFTYATDRSPLRAKLAKRLPVEEDRYTDPVRPGERTSLSIVRVQYDDPGWLTNRNYGSWDIARKYVAEKAKVHLTVNEEGTAPADLGEADAAYLTGAGEIPLAADQQQALKAYLEGGGFLWAEAACGNPSFIGNFRKLVLDMGLTFKRIPQTEAILNGRFDGEAKGYGLISGVEFQRSLRVSRLGQNHADLMGLYLDDQLVGVFSMFDILFSTTGYNAYGCRGYKPQDAKAVATNIVLYLSQR
ncbi:MAG: DUF4159 domain-containing protein [Phycisphaerae bacterium]